MRRLLLISSLLLLLLGSCSKKQEELKFFRTWQEILESDTLRIGTMTSPNDFYLIQGEPLGSEYQKVLDFSRAHGLALDIQITHSIDSLLLLLDEGRIDLNITPSSMTKSHSEHYLFAGIVDTSALVLVQKKGEEELIKTLSDFVGREIYAEHQSVAELRLRQIQSEIGAENQFHIILSDTLSSEELLVQMVQFDSIDYVVCQDYLAEIATRYYPELDPSFRISQPIRFAWTVHKDNLSLKDALDDYFLEEERLHYYAQLKVQSSHLQRYIREEQKGAIGVKMVNGAISQYDLLFREAAKRIPWHWTLLAAMAFYESTFRSDVIAWSGARGLMGIMPRTGQSFGATPEQLLLPEVSIRVAVDCLLEYSRYFDVVAPPHEQLLFTLAAYNAGVGHVQDAMRLARKYNAPDTIWHEGVREYILLKSNPAYYNDEVVRYGYLRGSETANYVDNVVARQVAYQALIDRNR